MPKIRNTHFVGNLFFIYTEKFYNNDIIIMMSLVLKAQSPMKYPPPPAAATLLGLGVTSTKEQVKQINFYLLTT